MKEIIYIIGHKNPDTDSIASALAYADLKRQLGQEALACRLGTLNEETKFATRYFDIEAPELMIDARSMLKDIKLDEPVFIDKDDTINDAYHKVMKTNSKTLYVKDKKDRFLGIVSMGDLASLRIKSKAQRTRFMRYATLKTLAHDLKGKIINDAPFKTSGEIQMVTKTSLENLKDAIQETIAIVTDNEGLQAEVIDMKPAVMIIGFGMRPSEVVIKKAKEKAIPIIVSKMAPIEMIRIIYEAISVKYIMSKDIIAYHIDDYVEDVATEIATTRFRAYPVIDDKGSVVASLSRFHLFRYPKKKFILVDHSSLSQTIDNIDKAEIKEIIDHHHIGNVETKRPIFYRNECTGCTATIIYHLYLENGKLPDRKIAGMMLSAIISDTLYFKSETTTDKDRLAARSLAKIADVKLEEYASEFLASSVNLKDGDVKDLLKSDLKAYEFAGHKIVVGQTNYQNIEDIQLRIKDFEVAMQDELEAKGYDLIVMMFTHVLAEGTMFMYYGKLAKIMPQIIESSFDEHSGYDHKIMSRKQQLIPAISEILER